MQIVGRKLSRAEFEKYVEQKNFGSVPPSWLVLHHTWKPTIQDWQGKQSILSLKSYYESLGWQAGPHLFVAEDGIWLFTDMYEVGIHAGKGNATWKNKYTGQYFYGYSPSTPASYKIVGYSIGIEVVGNYDSKKWSGQTFENAVAAIAILNKKLNLSREDLKFHRDYSNKTCPGKAITKEWVFEQVDKYTAANQSTSDINSLKILDFWKKADPIYASDLDQTGGYYNFDSQYKIKNTSSKTITIERLALALHSQSNQFISDLLDPETKEPRYFDNLKIEPGQTFHFPLSLANLEKAGFYQVVVKAKILGKWAELKRLEFEVEENIQKRFTDPTSISRMREIIVKMEKSTGIDLGNILSSVEKDKLIQWIEEKSQTEKSWLEKILD